MSAAVLRIVPIVEGHGEVEAIGVLLRRLVPFLSPQTVTTVHRAIRIPRSGFLEPETLARHIDLALRKLQGNPEEGPSLVLILFDADRDLPCVLAPRILAEARSRFPRKDVEVVLAEKEYESWFVAAAASLGAFLREEAPPNAAILGKGWIEKHFRRAKYSETIDQAKLTAAMDLELCRARSASFDKLCRVLENRLSEKI